MRVVVRGRRRLIAAALVTLATLGPAACGSPAEPAAAPAGEPVVVPTVVERPERLIVPAMDLEAPIIPLGLEPDGSLEVPTDPWDTGWFTGGAEPGETGPAVIAGHVDSKTGPAVFHRLRELTEGDEITVVGEGGETATFTVYARAQYAKAQFPTDDVYGPTAEPELRLITCGGGFDREIGHYKDNFVVFARSAL